MRALTAVLFLLALALPVAAQPVEPERPKHWNLQVAAVSVKMTPMYLGAIGAIPQGELLRVRLSYDRLSIGATLARLTFDYINVPTFHAGYTFYRRTAQQGSLRSMRPEAYVEIEAIPPGFNFSDDRSGWMGRVAACCDIDYYFVGATGEVGIMSYGYYPAPEVSVGLRLVTNFGF